MYFDGTPEEAFLEFLLRNARRGLGLTLRERRRAAVTLLELHPEWSDRRLAEVCALSPRTVAALRQPEGCPTDENARCDKREGRDGRWRPVRQVGVESRVLNAEQNNPNGSLREIGMIAGVSRETVRRIRARRANQPFPAGSTYEIGATAARGLSYLAGRAPCSEDPQWRGDRALRSVDDGGVFLQWFERSNVDEDWQQHVDSVPLSRIYEIAEEARRRAGLWVCFAQAIEARVR
jgi:hypothetical protein